MRIEINAERAKSLVWSMKNHLAQAGYDVPNTALLEAFSKGLGFTNYRTLKVASDSSSLQTTVPAEIPEHAPAMVNSQPQYVVALCWGHIFAGSREQAVDFVFDRATNRIVYMEFSSHNDSATPATRAEMDDVQDSLINANSEALEDPASWELEEVDELPDWVPQN
jgi:hypothetical protein